MDLQQYIEKKLDKGVYKLMENKVGKSAVWSIFALIAKEDGSIFNGFVCCRQCKKLVKYSKKITIYVYRHKCFKSSRQTAKYSINEDANETDDSTMEDHENLSSGQQMVVHENNEPIEDEDKSVDCGHNVINKKHVELQIKTGVYKLEANTKGRSKYWTVLKFIIKEDGTTLNGHVWCTVCGKLLVYTAQSSSNLGRHKCILSLDEPPTKKVKNKDNTEDSSLLEELSALETNNTEDECNSVQSDGVNIIKIENEDYAEDELLWEERQSLNNMDDTTLYSLHTDLKIKLKSGVYTLMDMPNRRSGIWTVFALIVKDDGTTADGYVCCRRCECLLKFNGKSTSNLNRHKCYMAAAKTSPPKTVNEDHKKVALDVCSSWIIQDCLPSNIIKGEGFHKMANFLIEIGALFGDHVDVDDMLPDLKMIADHIRTRAEEKKSEVTLKIDEISDDVSVTVNFWTEDCARRQFLSATLHFCKNFQINCIKLGIKSTDITHTNVQQIQNKLMRLLGEFGITQMEKIVFVTDTQSVAQHTLGNYTRLICSNHLLSKVIDDAITLTVDLNEVIDDCKSIVKYLKTNHQQIPKDMAKSAFPYQWNSKYVLLKALANNWVTVQQNFDDVADAKIQWLIKKNIVILQGMVELCQNFEVIFKKLQCSRSPSLCFVIPSINRLRAFCENKENENDLICAFKANLLKCIDETWLPNVTLWHKAAFFLYSPANKQQAHDLNEIKDFCIKQITNYEQRSPKAEAPATSCSLPPQKPSECAANKSSTKEDIYFFFPALVKETHVTTPESIAEEVNRYSLERVMINEYFDVLQWWSANRNSYPRLSILALHILSIPASNIASQRVFALTGNLIAEKLNKFIPKTVENILFLNSIYENPL